MFNQDCGFQAFIWFHTQLHLSFNKIRKYMFLPPHHIKSYRYLYIYQKLRFQKHFVNLGHIMERSVVSDKVISNFNNKLCFRSCLVTKSELSSTAFSPSSNSSSSSPQRQLENYNVVVIFYQSLKNSLTRIFPCCILHKCLNLTYATIDFSMNGQ